MANKRGKRDLGQESIRSLLGMLKPGQLWAIIVAASLIVSGAFTLGYKIEGMLSPEPTPPPIVDSKKFEQLKDFLGGLEERDAISVYLPMFEDVLVEPPAKELTKIRISAVSLEDILAVSNVLDLLSPLGLGPSSQNVRILSADNFRDFSRDGAKLIFVIGGPPSNAVSNTLMKRRTDIDFSIKAEEVTATYKPPGKQPITFVHRSPVEEPTEVVRQKPSFGVIVRFNDKDRSIFVIFGGGERGTRLAGRWFADSWETEVKARFGNGEFAAFLDIPPGGKPGRVLRPDDLSVLIPERRLRR